MLLIWSLFWIKYLELLETIFISGLKFIYNDFNKSSKPLKTESTIIKDDVLGKLKILNKDEVVDEYDLLAYENIKKVNIFSRLVRSINYLIWGDV